MADLQGYSFTPGQSGRFRASLNAPRSGLGPLAQEALQILSLHLPNLIGGAPVAPEALLRPRPGAPAGEFIASRLTAPAVPATAPAPVIPASVAPQVTDVPVGPRMPAPFTPALQRLATSALVPPSPFPAPAQEGPIPRLLPRGPWVTVGPVGAREGLQGPGAMQSTMQSTMQSISNLLRALASPTVSSFQAAPAPAVSPFQAAPESFYKGEGGRADIGPF